MTSRRYPHRVTIQQPSREEQPSGQIVYSWSTYATRWASVQPAGSDEGEQNDRLTPQRNYTIQLQWDADTAAIGSDFRVLDLDRGTAINLTAAEVQHEGRRKTVMLSGTIDTDYAP